MIKLYISCLCISLSTFLTGCVSVFPSSGTSTQYVTLNIPTKTYTAQTPKPINIMVEEPRTLLVLDDTKIRIQDNSKNYFSKIIQGFEWSDRVPMILQYHLIKTLSSSGVWQGIGDNNSGIKPDFILKTDIEDFHVISTSLEQVDVNYQLAIIRAEDRQIVNNKTFSATVRIEKTGIEGIVNAFNTALEMTLQEAIPWIAKHT